MLRKSMVFCLLLLSFLKLSAQENDELNSGWQCMNVAMVKTTGQELSDPNYHLSGWLAATIPGTVLTTLLNNKQVPDPMYGMNNEKIPDIYHIGRNHYTYWFVNDFNEKPATGNGQVWLHFRGVNDGCDIYLNGHRLTATTHYGAYLRQTYNITPWLAKNGKNRLAVIVYPSAYPGNPNGGQGGDGTIAKNVAPQYTAGWDWIQPMRDRNTGIWDKVTIERTGAVRIKDPQVITRVPGVRKPEEPQAPAIIQVGATLENATAASVTGVLRYTLQGNTIDKKVTLAPHATIVVQLPDLMLKQPLLWWPAGYGPQQLYQLQLQFLDNGRRDDTENVEFGIREIQTYWNAHTRSREVAVNGQRIFIKGGNWITSDAMFRFSQERYDAEVRFHRDMHLNLIRIWGGSLTERPEFYEACDKYGLLVFQDFWMSGDCNGRWQDPLKKEDQWSRRQYPDDHSLFLESVADQVKMLRNYPSLAFWCGGNEITPPADIFNAMKDTLLPALDGTRYFFDYSNSDSMSYNSLGGNGDGPYGIQTIAHFWNERTFPFNSEVGSVGAGDYESLERFLPAESLVTPDATGKTEAVWNYHKYIAYNNAIDPYGKTTDLKEWANKAQLANYDQYRALMEGFSAHMWDWYTGVIIWKTQNPWTALRGQMYDYYLDPNACLYGTRKGATPLHVMYNPVDGMVMAVNNTFNYARNLMLELKAYDMQGHDTLLTQVFVEVGPSMVQPYLSVKEAIDQLRAKQGVFFSLRLFNASQEVVDENLYWLPDAAGNYSGLQQMPAANNITLTAHQSAADSITVTLSNPAGAPLAFFNRLSLVNASSKKRILPVFYSDNYITVLPGEKKTVTISGAMVNRAGAALIEVYGHNVKRLYITVQ
ncbi:glycosyl hydrolase 2 galactose-binding domain-containing protein [Chitinophaga sp. 30R24]|uniref:glycoside hydrolase family 2 protein n=1 Tax=Chitinophaga sp. 30R24 TaxID=3248838 RepID=UPI003B921195